MKVTLIQMDIIWETPKANRETTERLMRSAEKSDLYVLPEMWNTGVTTEPQRIAPSLNPSPEEEGCPSLQWMQRMANELDAAVAGSMAVKTPDGAFRNRLYFVTPQEIVQWSMVNGMISTTSSPMVARQRTILQVMNK